MILQSKIRNLRHLNNLQHVLTANRQYIFQKNVGVVPMQQIKPNGLNKSIQQTIEIMGKTMAHAGPSTILKNSLN